LRNFASFFASFCDFCCCFCAKRAKKPQGRTGNGSSIQLLVLLTEVVSMYKPNFCAECGTKLLRLRWHLWTSRRFCNDCARRLRKARLAPALIATLALISAGYVAGRMRRPAPPPLTIERRSDSPLGDAVPGQSTQRTLATQSGATQPGVEPGKNSAASSSSPSSAVVDATSDGTVLAVYTCGARTQKGTPCSRRVHGPVRCWQHQGRPAMLPQEKLIVKDLAP
jgi:hypothetical protein